MSTRAKFLYFVLALIMAFTGLGAVALTAVEADDLAGWNQVESAGFSNGGPSQPTHVIAGDCDGVPGGTCP
jgi:hypothetical protein